jgi:hypothetical protein
VTLASEEQLYWILDPAGPRSDDLLIVDLLIVRIPTGQQLGAITEFSVIGRSARPSILADCDAASGPPQRHFQVSVLGRFNERVCRETRLP